MFPELQLVVGDVIGAGDKVVVRWTAMHAPPHKGTAIYRLQDGQIVERWVDVTFLEP